MFESTLIICFKPVRKFKSKCYLYILKYKLDTFNKVVIKDDKKVIHLTKYQYKFLDILIKNRGRIVSYEEIEGLFGKIDFE